MSLRVINSPNRVAVSALINLVGERCGNAPKSATAMSYGHTGYTGIMIWNDPAYNLNYVFLSNRVYPTRDNNKISTLNVRTAIMQVVYEGLGK